MYPYLLGEKTLRRASRESSVLSWREDSPGEYSDIKSRGLRHLAHLGVDGLFVPSTMGF